MPPVSEPFETIICNPLILENVLSHLSASESALVLAITGILYTKEGEYFKERYVNLIHDIPEHAPWVNAMLSQGHRAFLIGSDIYRWKMRLRYPLTYWKMYCGPTGWDERPLRLWLAVRVGRSLLKQPHQPYSIAYIGMNGESVRGRAAKGLRDKGKILTRATVIPPPTDARPRNPYTAFTTEGEWRRTSRPNMSKLEIVYAHFEDVQDETPQVRMCPLQAADRGPEDLMEGSHGKEGHRCASIPPGSVLERSPYAQGQVIPKLPYFDLGKNRYELAEPVDDDMNRYAFSVHFYCRGNGPFVRRNIQGIPWGEEDSSGAIV